MGCHTYRIHNLFNATLVTTADPENIQAILATKFHDFDLGPDRRGNFYEALGNGIFTAEGEAWARYRHQLKPQFSRDQVSDVEAAERHLQILWKALPEENADGWVEKANIMPLIYRFTMDVSTEFLFGESVNSQSNALHALDSGNSKEVEEELDFAEAMTHAQEFITWRMRMGKLYWLFSSKKFKKSCKTIKEFGDRFVRIVLDDEKQKRPKVLEEGRKKFVLLDELVTETRDPVELRDQILHLLLAGRDTTSALLCWTILLLSRHPDELNKLRSTIISQFGTASDPKDELGFASLKACKQLTYVLYETLRLYPLVPLNGRTALRDTYLPTGGGPDRKQPLAIRKGENMGYSAYVMHRRHDIWGGDAEEFKPSRWEGRKLGWEFIPFSGGPRVCLGRAFTSIFSFEGAHLLMRE
jgi:cytochrome P450